MDTPLVDTVRWPGSPYDLADTAKCPACFTPIAPTASGAAPSSCATCGLPLTDAQLGTVLRLGQDILSLELARRETLVQIRAAQAARIAAAETATRRAPVRARVDADPRPAQVDLRRARAPVQDAHGAAPASAPVSRPAQPMARPLGTAAPAPAVIATPTVTVPPMPPRPEPRRVRPRITVPVLLLIVGVSLVGIAAIFFLTLAWFVADIAVRALIIGAITLATLVVASLLRRRDLTATAEAIAVIGILLVGLDAWAVRANGLLGADAMGGTLYAGFATLAVAVVCRAWARLSHLRAPDLASVIALPAGLGLLVGGLSAMPAGPAWVLGLVGAAVGGIAFALPAPWSAARDESTGERTTLAAIGLSALVAATGLSFFVAPRDIAFVLWAVPLLVIVAAAWWVALARRAARIRIDWAPTFAMVVACTGVAAAATLGWQLALRGDSSWLPLVLSPVIAVAVAVAVDLMRTRAGLPAAAFGAAAVIAAAGLVFAVTLWLSLAVTAIGRGWLPWHTDPFAGSWRTDPFAGSWRTDPFAGEPSPDAFLPLTAATIVVALLWLTPSLRHQGVRALRTTASAVLLVVGAASTGRPVVVVGVALAVTAGAVIVAYVESRREVPATSLQVAPQEPGAPGVPVEPAASGAPGTIAVWAAPAALGAATAYAAGTATTWLWVVAALVAIALPVVLARTLTAAGRGTATLHATSTVLALGVAAVSAFVAPQAIAAAVGTDSGAGLAGFALLQWVALVSIGLALWTAPGVVRRTLAISGVTLAAASLIPTILAAIPEAAGLVSSGPVSAAIGEPWAALIRGVALVAALGAVAWARVRGGFPTGVAATAAVLLAPSVGAVIVAITHLADIPDATPPLATGAFALLCLGSALAMLRTRSAAAVRAAADTGALVATALVAWQSRSDVAWLVLLLIGGALAAMSITRGWAAPRAATLAGVATAPSEGMPFAAAQRRVLVWAAFAFGVAALWAAVGQSRLFGDRPTLEAYTLAPAAGLIALTLVLTWLRRHAEATVAATLAALVGVVAPASTALFTHEPARPIIATAVAAALCAALAWTAARRLPGVSVAAVTALAGAALGAVVMAQWPPVAHSAWAIVPVVAAFLAATGFERGAAPAAAVRPSLGQHRFAAAAPSVAIVVAAAAVANVMLIRDAWRVGALAIALLLTLSLTAAAVDRVPLGVATRWTAMGGAALIGAALLLRGATVELVTLPTAAALLGGAALAMRRLARRGAAWPGVETVPWIAGVVVAVVPSLLAEPVPGRLWLLVSACLLVAVGLAAVSPAQTMALTASTVAVTTGGVLIAGLRAALELAAPHGFAVALVAGAGTAGVGAVTVWRRVPPPALARAAASAGAALVAFAVAVCGDGSVTQTLIVVAIATVAALGAALALSRPVWLPVAGILTLGGLVVTLVAVAARLARVTPAPTGGVEPDAWVLAVALIVAAVGAVALRASSRAAAGTTPDIQAVVARAVGAAFAVTVVLVALAESWLLWSGGDDTRPARAGVTILLLTATAVAGALLQRRVGPALGIAAWSAVAVVAVIAVLAGGARPFEVVTFAPALGLLALGIRRLRLDATVRSWPALGPGLALATVPSLLHDFGPNDLWRIVALGVVAVALVVVGATRRLQAPLILGTVVLLVHAVAQLWPWIAGAYDAVPWWLWVGLGGILLIVIAARYERQLKALRTAYAAVTGLR